MEQEPVVADSGAECVYVSYEDLEPVNPAPETYDGALKSLDWKIQFATLTALRQVNKHLPDVFFEVGITLLPQLISLSDSIRSNLSKNALMLITEMFLIPHPTHLQVAETLVPGLMQKTISEKAFIKQQAANAMRNLCRTAASPGVLRTLEGLCWHKSGTLCDNAFLYLKQAYETSPPEEVFRSAAGLLNSKRKKIESGAVAALKELQSHPNFPALMESLEPPVRTEVERVLAEHTAEGSTKDIKSFIEARKKALQDSN